MAKSFFTDSDGNWRPESKRTTLWWGIMIAGVALGGLIGSFIPVPGLGTLLGMAIGGYIGAVVHNEISKRAIGPIDPIRENIIRPVKSALAGATATVKAIVSGKSDDEIADAATTTYHRSENRHWLKSTFWTGPARQASKVMKETEDFFSAKFNI